MAEQGIKTLLKVLERYVSDTEKVLDIYEVSHDERELCYSRDYNALSAGHFALKDTIDQINYQLNKK